MENQTQSPNGSFPAGATGVLLKGKNGQVTRVPFSELQQTDPFLYEKYVSNVASPNTQLQQQQVGVQQQQAELPGEQAQSQIAQQDVAPASQKASQVAFMQSAKNQLDDAVNPKTGYVDPQTYNKIQSQGAAIGITQDQMDAGLGSTYTNPANQFGYNTTQGRAVMAQYGVNKRSYQNGIDLYNQIPQGQKNGVGGLTADFGVLSNFLSPQAVAYNKYLNTLPANLRNQLPGVTDSPEEAQSKVLNYNANLKSVTGSPQGLDSQYLPKDPTTPEGGGGINSIENVLNPVSNIATAASNIEKGGIGGNDQTKGNFLNSILNAGKQTGNAIAQVPRLAVTSGEFAGAFTGGGALASFLKGDPIPPPGGSGIQFGESGAEQFPNDITQTPEAQNYQTPMQQGRAAAQQGAIANQGNPFLNFLGNALKSQVGRTVETVTGYDLLQHLFSGGNSNSNQSSGSPLGF